MLFGGNRNGTSINLRGNPLEMVNSTTYLGVTIDNKLTFNPQIEKLKNSVNDRMNMLKILMAPKLGCHPQSAIKIYKSIVESYLYYGISITGNASKTSINKLQVIINSCCRKISGCTKSTPINSLAALTGICPINIAIEFIAKKELSRQAYTKGPIYKQMQHISHLDASTSKLTYIEKIFIENKNRFERIYQLKSNVEFDKNYIVFKFDNEDIRKTDYSPPQLKTITLEMIDKLYANKIKIFTDASIINQEVGIGVYSLNIINKSILSIL